MLYNKAASTSHGASARSAHLPRQKIAVIGAGIAGLGAAYDLCHHHDVTIFEARKRLGGHARTLIAGRDAQLAVDTGFMVFNYLNYPHLNQLFEDLKIPVKKSNMSFAVSLDDGKFEYGLHQPSRIFAQRKNLANPRFYKMLLDIFKFNKHGLAYLDNPQATLEEALDEIGVSRMFRERYIGPLAGAIWSMTVDEMMGFPIQTLVKFFDSHRLNSVNDHPTWYTIDGGSSVYVERMVSALKAQGCTIKEATPIASVTRAKTKSTVTAKDGESGEFDHVIFACHSDQALKILAAPTPLENDVLGAIRFKKNQVILHDDPAQMPKRKGCWSSWVYKGNTDTTQTNATTYWMNFRQKRLMTAKTLHGGD